MTINNRKKTDIFARKLDDVMEGVCMEAPVTSYRISRTTDETNAIVYVLDVDLQNKPSVSITMNVLDVCYTPPHRLAFAISDALSRQNAEN